MNDLFAHLVVQEVAFSLFPGLLIVHKCFDQFWIVFELRVHDLNILLVLPHELSELYEGGSYLFSKFSHCLGLVWGDS